MEGLLYLTDEDNRRRFLQIDLSKFDREVIEDLVDGLLAEARRDEDSIPYEEVRAGLKAAGKLDA